MALRWEGAATKQAPVPAVEGVEEVEGVRPELVRHAVELVRPRTGMAAFGKIRPDACRWRTAFVRLVWELLWHKWVPACLEA